MPLHLNETPATPINTALRLGVQQLLNVRLHCLGLGRGRIALDELAVAVDEPGVSNLFNTPRTI